MTGLDDDIARADEQIARAREIIQKPRSARDPWQRLGEIIPLLLERYNDHAEILVAERRARVAGLEATDGNASYRDQQAAINAISHTAEAIRTGNEIKALEAERDYLMFVIEHTG